MAQNATTPFFTQKWTTFFDNYQVAWILKLSISSFVHLNDFMSIYQNQVKLETSVSKSALKFYQKQFQDTQVVDLFENTKGFKRFNILK